MSETPPLRSSPRRVGFVAMTASDPASSPATRSRTSRLRRRSVMAGAGLLGGGEDEEHAAVLVVGREEVRRRLRREVALGVDLDGLAERPDPPLEHGADRVVGVREAQPEHVLHGPADDALVVEPRQLERAASAADDAPLRVADEERGVGRRVVVVEQLEEEAEAALRAPLGLAAEAGGAIALGRAVAAVRADEQMGHALGTGYAVRIGPVLEERGLVRRVEPEVLEGAPRGGPAAGRALEQAALQQVGLVDVLERVGLLVDRDGQRRE